MDLPEEDQNRGCSYYPNEQFVTYEECYAEKISNKLPVDLKPFWTVNNISDASNLFEYDNTTYLQSYDRLFINLGKS